MANATMRSRLAALRGNPEPTTQKIRLDAIILDAGTQQRTIRADMVLIAEYAERMAEGDRFPPITVFSDGTNYWLVDGFQRVEAAKQVGYHDIAAEVIRGGLRDAILYSCGANATHGKPRDRLDKRQAVLTLLNDDEWVRWTDRHIAQVCHVSHPFVAEVRRSLASAVTGNVASDDSNTRQYVDKHGHVSTMRTANIGKRATGEHKPIEAPEASPAPQPVLIEDEAPSHGLPFAENGAPSSPVGITFRTSTLSLCPTCERVRPLMAEAVVHLQHLAEAANIRGYAEYRDLEYTLLALQHAAKGGDHGA